jgi:hypothetical protein
MELNLNVPANKYEFFNLNFILLSGTLPLQYWCYLIPALHLNTVSSIAVYCTLLIFLRPSINVLR